MPDHGPVTAEAQSITEWLAYCSAAGGFVTGPEVERLLHNMEALTERIKELEDFPALRRASGYTHRAVQPRWSPQVIDCKTGAVKQL